MSEYDENNCLDIVTNGTIIFVQAAVLTTGYMCYQYKVIKKNDDILSTNNGYMRKHMRTMLAIQLCMLSLYLIMAIMQHNNSDDTVPYISMLTISQSLTNIQSVVLFVFLNKLKYAEIEL